MKKNAGTFTILKLVQFVITLFSYLFRTLCKNTNLPAFSTLNLFLNLEWTIDQKLKKLFQYLHLMILQFARYKFFKCFSINDAAIFMDRFPVLHYNSATLHSQPRMSIKNENVYFRSLWRWRQGGFLLWVINSITCHQSSPSQTLEVNITYSERVFLLQWNNVWNKSALGTKPNNHS